GRRRGRHIGAVAGWRGSGRVLVLVLVLVGVVESVLHSEHGDLLSHLCAGERRRSLLPPSGGEAQSWSICSIARSRASAAAGSSLSRRRVIARRAAEIRSRLLRSGQRPKASAKKLS